MSFLDRWHITFEHPWVLLLLALVPLTAYLLGQRGGVAAVVFSSISADTTVFAALLFNCSTSSCAQDNSGSTNSRS